MKEISAFFDKFKNVALREINKREIICKCIEKVIKQKIEIKDIQIREGVVIVKCHQILKSEIFLKKKQILDNLSKNTDFKIIDIK